MKKEYAIYNRPDCVVIGGKVAHGTKPEKVRVLARAEKWALVRNEYKNTFAVMEKELSPMPATPAQKGDKI